MSTDPAADGTPRRRRRRATRAQGAPELTPPSPAVAEKPAPKPPSKRRPARDSGSERGLRDLVGAGRSQLGVSGALRARDVNRPSEQDLTDAERNVVVLRRNWKPPTAG